ncbi:M48 family metallopeptidase [Engelhardtia mirabilis]|uniref:SprT-like family protein n=1 Tax=Engelhardtia mirabilis TaxID=2528011 RepID=A0A518BQ61_9BACT|nr:hypothetical protein Pla133_42230 [Planctomycetes bacterium Pla133]QDV03434.1 hypothetical protein Pla86_42220 [Planctomycetes bacterium Pla86]
MADRQLDLFAGPPPLTPVRGEANADPIASAEVAPPTPTGPAPYPPNLWAEAVGGILEAPVEVVYGRSRRLPVQLERRGGRGGPRYRLRLHHMFAEAPEQARADLLAWLRAGRRARAASARLDAWIAAGLAALPPAPRRSMTLSSEGDVHDLAQITRAVVEDPSAGPVRRLAPLPPVGWGRWPTRAPRRRIQLGAFDAAARAVRIHPVLDDAAAPRSVLEYVVFHELLHAAVGNADGRLHHGPTFSAAERAFDGTAAANAWIDARTPALIEKVARRVRRGRRRG